MRKCWLVWVEVSIFTKKCMPSYLTRYAFFDCEWHTPPHQDLREAPSTKFQCILIGAFYAKPSTYFLGSTARNPFFHFINVGYTPEQSEFLHRIINRAIEIGRGAELSRTLSYVNKICFIQGNFFIVPMELCNLEFISFVLGIITFYLFDLTQS